MAALAALALAATGCGERATAAFQLDAAKGEPARAAAMLLEGNPLDDEALFADPLSDLPPPSWLDGETVVRVNGVPLLPTSVSGFGVELSDFDMGTPVSFEVADDQEVLLITPPLRIDPPSIVGPTPGSARSASEELTVTFDRDVSSLVMTMVRDPRSDTFASPTKATRTTRTIEAAELQALRERAVAAGAPEGPDGFEVEVLAMGRASFREQATSGVFESFNAIVTVTVDRSVIVLTP